MKIKFRKVGTFNCQGLNGAVKQQQIADDFIHHNLSATMVQETVRHTISHLVYHLCYVHFVCMSTSVQ